MSKMIYLASRESSLSDPTYRYQIQRLDIKTLGKTGNYTTYFLNSEDIAKKINRTSDMFGKFIGNALSCPMKYDKEKNCLTFKGTYTYDVILKHFMDFVKIYVLCPTCDYPEMSLYKNGVICYHCNSCGSDDKLKIKSFDKTYEYIEKNIK